MATHAYSTRTPLLPPAGALSPLLRRGVGNQVGPVTAALRTMRAADPADAAIDAIRDGLDRHFAAADRQRVRALRKAIGDRIEADIALLDALAGDADLEPDDHHGGDINDEPHDPEEDDDRDSGCADMEGAIEQYGDLTRHAAVYA